MSKRTKEDINNNNRSQSQTLFEEEDMSNIKYEKDHMFNDKFSMVGSHLPKVEHQVIKKVSEAFLGASQKNGSDLQQHAVSLIRQNFLSLDFDTMEEVIDMVIMCSWTCGTDEASINDSKKKTHQAKYKDRAPQKQQDEKNKKVLTYFKCLLVGANDEDIKRSGWATVFQALGPTLRNVATPMIDKCWVVPKQPWKYTRAAFKLMTLEQVVKTIKWMKWSCLKTLNYLTTTIQRFYQKNPSAVKSGINIWDFDKMPAEKQNKLPNLVTTGMFIEHWDPERAADDDSNILFYIKGAYIVRASNILFSGTDFSVGSNMMINTELERNCVALYRVLGNLMVDITGLKEFEIDKTVFASGAKLKGAVNKHTMMVTSHVHYWTSELVRVMSGGSTNRSQAVLEYEGFKDDLDDIDF